MKTSQGIVLKGIADISVYISSLIIFPILVRNLGADGYGFYILINTMINFLIPFSSLGFIESVIRFFPAFEWNINVKRLLIRILLLVLAVTCFVSILFYLLSPVINTIYNKGNIGIEIFRWASPLIILSSIELLLYNFFRSRKWLINYSIIQIIEVVILVFSVVLFISGNKIVTLLQINISVKLFTIVFMLVSLWTWNKPSNKVVLNDKISLRKMIKFGIPAAFTGYGFWMMSVGDRAIIGKYLSPESLGLYGAACSFAALINSVYAPLYIHFYPQLVGAVTKGSDEDVIKDIRIYHRYTQILALPSVVFMIIILNPLLALLSNSVFQPDFWLVFMIVLPFLFAAWNAPAQYILLCKDKVYFMQNTWLVMGGINVLLNLVLVPVWGLHGAALTTLLTGFALQLLFFAKSNKYIPLFRAYRYDTTFRCGISSVLAGVIAFVWISIVKYDIAGIVTCALIFSLIYFILIVLFREIRREDYNLLLKIIYVKRKS